MAIYAINLLSDEVQFKLKLNGCVFTFGICNYSSNMDNNQCLACLDDTHMHRHTH